jgi:serine/threonine protein phosphatase PrpC
MRDHRRANRVEAACVSDPGLERAENQDSYLLDLDQALFIVSDGIGGHQAGEVASRAVVTVFADMLQRQLPSLMEGNDRQVEMAMREVVVEFNQRLRSESASRAGLQGMGATLILVWIRNMQSKAYLVSMGDSRIYLLRKEKLGQLTEDHTISAFLLKHGVITPEQALDHPGQHKLSRYIGMEGEVYPDVQTLRLHPGDRLLLCSDGLTNMVSDEEIREILLSAAQECSRQPQATCKALVQAAIQGGGADNITALVIDYLSTEIQSK